MTLSTGLSDDERKAGSLRPIFEPVPSMARRLGIGQTKAWQLIRDDKIKVVRIGTRTLADVASIDSYAEELRAKAANRGPSRWARECGALARAANKGRLRGSARRKAGNEAT
jgi:hypothetical protein